MDGAFRCAAPHDAWEGAAAAEAVSGSSAQGPAQRPAWIACTSDGLREQAGGDGWLQCCAGRPQGALQAGLGRQVDWSAPCESC